MADDPIKSFMVQMGFVGDPAGAKKVTEEAAKVEAAVTKSAEEGAAKREAIEAGATAKRIGLAEGLGKIISELEQHRAERETKIRKDEAAQDEKLQAEREKKAKERRAKAVKDMAAHATRMASFALKAVAAVEATALGIVYAVDRAAKSMERLGYASARAGSTPGKMTATGYAFSQLGGTAESGQSAINALGEKLKTPGYDRYLKTIGVEARKTNGELKDTGDILADLGEQLAKRQKEGGASGYRIAQAHAEALGLNTDQMQTIEDPRYRRMYAERQAIDAKMGTDEGAGAEAGSKFETSMRRLEATIGSLRTKVATDLTKNIQPTLDKLAAFVSDHGQEIADTVVKIADGIIKFANSIIDNLAKVNWDAVIKDVSDFGDKLDKKMTELFGDDGKMALALAGFAGLVGVKVLGPLNAVIRTLQIMGSIPIVGRLLGGAALTNPVGLTATALTVGGAADAEMARRTAAAMGDPNAKFDPETGFVNDLDFGYGENKREASATGSNPKTGAIAWLKGLFGLGSSDPDAKKTKDAIQAIAENTKKLADKTDGVGMDTAGGGGRGQYGGHSDAPSIRYGRPHSSRGGSAPVAPFKLTGNQAAQLGDGIRLAAQHLGIKPEDLGTVISYETAGTMDPWKAGPHTKWGQHRGLIQWGEPQARQYGVSKDSTIGQQMAAVERYLRDTGVKPGMGILDVYSAINAGRVGKYGASDGYGTVSSHVDRMTHSAHSTALARLDSQAKGGLTPGATATPEAASAPAQPEQHYTDPKAPGVVHLPEFEAADKILRSKTASAAQKAAAQKVVDRWNSQSFPQPGLVTVADQDRAAGRTYGPVPAPDTSDHTTYPTLRVNPKTGRADTSGAPEIDRSPPGGTADKPIHVEVTDKSAEKLGRGIGRRVFSAYAQRGEIRAQRAEAHAHLLATQAVLRAHRGHTLGVDPHSMLGRHIRHSIDMSRRSISIVHNPSFTMNGVGDPAAALSDAHRLAGRGQADLIRNLTTMTS